MLWPVQDIQRNLSEIGNKSTLIANFKKIDGVSAFYSQHAQIILFKGGSVRTMKHMQISDDGTMCIGKGGTIMLLASGHLTSTIRMSEGLRRSQ
jgi:hypothetical protein